MARTITRKSRRHSLLQIVAMLALLVAGLGGVALWRVHSVQLMTVESASMAPAIKRGDAVVLRPVAVDSITPGDVVSYRSPADQSVIITHRVMRVEKIWNLVITKGDNVSQADKPVPTSALIGRVDLRVAYLGYVINFLRSPIGLITTVYLPALTIVFLELKRLTNYYRKPTYRLLGYARH